MSLPGFGSSLWGWYNIASRVWCLLGFGLPVVCGLGRLFGSGDLRFGVDFAVGLVVVGG